MRIFKDAADRSWDIKITVGVISRVKTILQVDLTQIYNEAGKQIFEDPILLVNVLYVVCKEQADKLGITDIQFGESMVGDSLEGGAMALMESVADFFPSGKRKILNAQLAKGKQIGAEVTLKAIAEIDKLTADSFLKLHMNPQE